MGRTRPRGKLIEGKEWHGRGGESERKKEAEVRMITNKHINHKLCMAYAAHFPRGSNDARHVICTIYTAPTNDHKPHYKQQQHSTQ